jgi:hypothetical protein
MHCLDVFQNCLIRESNAFEEKVTIILQWRLDITRIRLYRGDDNVFQYDFFRWLYGPFGP